MRGKWRWVRRKSDSRRARASAIVEFAVVLPLLLTVVFGIIEYGWVFMVRQTMQSAAREGCRVAILATTVAPYTNVTNRVLEAMAPTGLGSPPVQIDMTHATAFNPLETVTVTVPYQDVSLVGGFFGIANYDMVASCTMRKE